MRTTTKINLIVLLFFATVTISYSQNWLGASRAGSDYFDYSGDIIIDNSGNAYLAGSFQGPFCYFNTDTLVRYGNNDFFLAKYDNNGNESWIKQFGGNNPASYNEGVGGICFDAINNYIYITGTFYGNANFGSTTLSSSQQAFFLAKFDLNGNCIWAKQSNGGLEVAGGGLDIDNSGNIYVSGVNKTGTSFDSFSVIGGGFLAKYDVNGNCVWAKNKFKLANPSWLGSEATPYGVKIYGSNILVAGSAGNDTVVVDTVTAISNSSNSAFIASFNLNGDVQWLKLGGRVSGDDLSLDNLGNIYLSGYFTGTGYFGSTVLTNGTQQDAFLAKYSINGALQWVKQLNATDGAWGRNVSTNSDGNTYMTGYFSGNANFGTFNITAATSKDMFVARYDPNGNCLGVRTFGQAEGNGVYANDNNSFWVVGGFYNSVSIGTNNFTSYGQNDIFIAKSDAITGVGQGKMTNDNKTLVIYANPNKGTCNITVPFDLMQEQNLMLNIYSNEGRLIQQIPVEINQEKVKINLEAEAKGLYNVTLGNSKKMYSGKIVFE